MDNQNFALGIFSGIAVIFVWSGFIVFSRMGVSTALTPFDISALRFMVAGAVTLPILWRFWPRDLAFSKAALLAICGPGAVYALMMYFGLRHAPAAYAGVFANGTIPIFTMLYAAIIARERPGPRRIFAVTIIIAGGIPVAWRGMSTGGPDLVAGLLLFVGASAILSLYLWGIGRWKLSPFQALAVVNVPNLVIFLPIWWFFLPSGLDQATSFDIVFQALFQGLGPGFLAVIFFTLAANHLGPTPTAAFSAAVPSGAALLAIPVLGEVPTPLEWGGVALVTAGLILLVLRRAR